MKDRFIVAEVSKTWRGQVSDTDTISTRFEDVIRVNERRGYKLNNFAFSQIHDGPRKLLETIVAVFELDDLQEHVASLQSDIKALNQIVDQVNQTNASLAGTLDRRING